MKFSRSDFRDAEVRIPPPQPASQSLTHTELGRALEMPHWSKLMPFSRYGETAGSMPVKEIMQYGVTTVSPDESVNRVMNLMTHHRVRHMPVLRDGKLAGIVSIGDVVKHRLEDLELETNVLRDVYNAAR